MDILASYSRRAEIMQADNLRPIVKKLQKLIHSKILESAEPRAVPAALARSAAFDLSYILVRHRPWHHAELLAELAIDYLSSEYLISGSTATQIVESALDLMHSYTTKEAEWSVQELEQEFLEHLLICSLSSQDEEALAIDLGFGRNVLDFLKSALDLESGSGVFHFASELTQNLSDIMQRVFNEIEASPASMDLYRLKNLLQRDVSTPKSKLKKDYLLNLNTILTSCGSEGRSEKHLRLLIEGEQFSTDLRLLIRSGLIYEEARSKRQGPLYRLSHKGHELTCMQFAFSHWQDVGKKLHLQDMPSAYQSTVLQLLVKKSTEQLLKLIATEGQYLSPLALRFLIDHLKQAADEKGLLEIFTNLLHNRAHAWIRVEICQALPLPSGQTLDGPDLDALINDDPSPMVRSAAKAALQRTRRMAQLPMPRIETR